MAARRRISRQSPLMLTLSEQKQVLAALDGDQELMAAVSKLAGKDLKEMKVQERIDAVLQVQQLGLLSAMLVQAVRARNDVINLAANNAERDEE